MQSQKPPGPVRAPQTHSQGTAHDYSTLGAPQSYPPPGHPNAGAPQAYHPTARAPQLYPTPSSNSQANTGASPQEYHPHPGHTQRNTVHVPGTGAPQTYPTSPVTSSPSASQDYTPPPIAISAAYKSLPPPPPAKKTSFPSAYSPNVSNNNSGSQHTTMPTIYNLPVVNTPLGPPSHSIGYEAQSTCHPSLGSSHTTPASCTPQVHHQTPIQQHTPVQQKQHVPVQQQHSPAQLQQHFPVQQLHSPVQQQHTPVQQPLTPVQQQLTPVQQQLAPVQQQYTPVQQQHTSVQQQYTPVQQQYTPVQQQQQLPAQQQHTPVQQQHTPVQQQHTSVQQQYTSVQQQYTPVQQQYTPAQQQQHLPAQQQHTPVQQQPTPVQQQPTPVQQQYTPVQQQQQLPAQQQHTLVQQQPTNTNFYTANVNANANANAQPVRQSTIYNPQPYPSTPQTHQYPNHTNIHPPPAYTPTTPYGAAPQPAQTTPTQHYPQRPAAQPAPAQPMFYPVQQPAAAPPSFHPPPLARVCCVTFNEHNKIRLIGANPETIPPLRYAIANCGAGLDEDAPMKGDGHEFCLSTRPWHTKERESIQSRLLLIAVLKAMAHCRWNIVQAAKISKMDSDRDFLMFESVDPGLGAIEMGDIDMFVMTLMGKDRIGIIGAGPSAPAVHGAIKQAILTHWKHPIKKDMVQEAYHEFQLEGNPWAPHKAEEAAAKTCMAQLLANVSALGYKLYVSLDIHKSSKDSESECLVFRRVGRVWR